MLKYLARRFVYYFLLIFIATSIAYLITSTVYDPRAAYEQRNPRPPQESIEAALNNMGVNDGIPLYQRYFTWLGKVFTGDLGITANGTPVIDQFGQRIGVSLRLLFIGAIIGLFIGVALGAWNAIKQYRLSDRLSMILAFVIISTPVFVIAIVLKSSVIWLNGVSGKQLVNFTGASSPGIHGFWPSLFDALNHLIVPTLVLALSAIATNSRYMRSLMLDALGSDYLRTARSKGLTNGQAIRKHGLRMAIIPMTTYFSYSMIGIITGAAIMERVFGWEGLGKWFFDSVNRMDVNSVTAYLGFSAIIVLISGFIADTLLALADPRIRL